MSLFSFYLSVKAGFTVQNGEYTGILLGYINFKQNAGLIHESCLSLQSIMNVSQERDGSSLKVYNGNIIAKSSSDKTYGIILL